MSGKPSKALYIEDVQKYICEECGTSVNVGDRYCHNCGYKLIWKRGIKINDSQND
jgi:DNA-directed RNA polymerase subunit RPC12/RpoP